MQCWDSHRWRPTSTGISTSKRGPPPPTAGSTDGEISGRKTDGGRLLHRTVNLEETLRSWAGGGNTKPYAAAAAISCCHVSEEKSEKEVRENWGQKLIVQSQISI